MHPYETNIQEALRNIEAEEGVRILYACESGSRAWGFPSQDSDYDVRFIYVRSTDWYLSIDDKRDVIERPINDLLDINGWDLRKALRLFRKSNPPLLEWLQSPIPYLEQTSAASQIRGMSPLAFSPKSCMYHYLSMARGNFRMYLQNEEVRLKKYFYVLRPIFACGWIEENGTMPPIAFDALFESQIPAGGDLHAIIADLLSRKKAGDELDRGPQIAALNGYLEERIAHFERSAVRVPVAGGGQSDCLSELFRRTLREAWGTENAAFQ
ncbi:nucleotidyltransferase domain-containing protein [Paenibacillus xanthanilyticus]|uniref:Nucleotidyltransferase domain-containing protein n=1 Tax=Paenibacillus xanthanilyticus TaxID=1783531 RepID=A0ABV8K433_9BACL